AAPIPARAQENRGIRASPSLHSFAKWQPRRAHRRNVARWFSRRGPREFANKRLEKRRLRHGIQLFPNQRGRSICSQLCGDGAEFLTSDALGCGDLGACRLANLFDFGLRKSPDSLSVRSRIALGRAPLLLDFDFYASQLFVRFSE